jgi:serpin B
VPRNITAFEKRLSPELLEEITGSIRDGGIHFSMPKLSLSYHAALPDALGSLGMKQASGGAADFSGMVEGAGLSLGQVEHEVFLAIDEEGTEAAAATGAEMVDSHGPTVEVNRPYVVVIRDKPTGAVLFVGTITDPSVKPKS